MTKKDFIAVAEALHGIPSSSDRWLTTNLIADSLAAAYSNFNIDKFIEYAMQWNNSQYGGQAKVGLTEKLQNNRNRNNSKIEVK